MVLVQLDSECLCCVILCARDYCVFFFFLLFVFFQAEDGIRDLVRSRGLGDVYKRQIQVSLFMFLEIGFNCSKCS